jgi:tetratricopeptide (TPR) repeat protein
MQLEYYGAAAFPPLEQLVAQAHAKSLFRACGAPGPEYLWQPGKAAVVALHLGTTYYRLALIEDVLNFFAARGRLRAENFVPLALIGETLEGQDPRATANHLCLQAIALNPGLAEAHYVLARLAQARGDANRALECFSAVLRLSPHPQSSPLACLHANAYWERATIFEDRGLYALALADYCAALTRLQNFGMHHVRVAQFLRRLGLLDEAAEQFRRCMPYNHRPFPEFILPPLVAPTVSAAPSIEVIHEMGQGERVVFWQGNYFAIPQLLWPATPEQLSQAAVVPASPMAPNRGRNGTQPSAVDGSSQTEIRRAKSIAAFVVVGP